MLTTFSTMSMTCLLDTSFLLSTLYSSMKESSILLSSESRPRPPDSFCSMSLTTPLSFMAFSTASSLLSPIMLSTSASFTDETRETTASIQRNEPGPETSQ